MMHTEHTELAERRLQEQVCRLFSKLLARAHAAGVRSNEWVDTEGELLELKDKLKRLGIEL